MVIIHKIQLTIAIVFTIAIFVLALFVLYQVIRGINLLEESNRNIEKINAAMIEKLIDIQEKKDENTRRDQP